MRTMEINTELLQYNQEFFESYEFVLMLAIIVVAMFVINSCMLALPYEELSSLVEGQLVYYIMLLLLCLMVFHLCKYSFNLGVTKMTDETKMECILAVKAFLGVFIFL